MARVAGAIYRYLTVVFLCLVIVEFFVAGLAVFGIATDATARGTTLTATDFDHRFAGHLLVGDAVDVVALLMLGLALGARMNRRRLRIPVALAVVVIVQAALAVVGPPAVEALHVVAGLLILGLAGYALRDARPFVARPDLGSRLA